MSISEPRKKNTSNLNSILKNQFSLRLNSHDPKRIQLQGQRITEIERANKILFDHITSILRNGRPANHTETRLTSQMCFAVERGYDAQLEFNINLRRYKTKSKGGDEFGLSPEKARELRSFIAKEHAEKMHEQQMIIHEISEKLPILAKQLPPKSLNVSHLHTERRHKILTSPSSLKEHSNHHLKAPRAKLLNQRDHSFDSKMDSKRLNSIFDESQDIHSQSFLEPTLRDESSMMDHHHSNQHASEVTRRRAPYGRTPSPFSEKTKSSDRNNISVTSSEKHHKILHKKAHMIHNQCYFIEIVRAEGQMVISAANQSRTKTAVKRIENNEALDILHDFKYNYDSLCSHLKIKDEDIDIEPPDTEQKAISNKKTNSKSDKSFDDHLNNDVSPGASKPKNMLINKELYDRLAKPRLPPPKTSPEKEIKPGSLVYQKIIPHDETKKKKVLEPIQNSRPLVQEYSSYGRKNNLQQGKDGDLKLPWSNETAPVIKRGKKVAPNNSNPENKAEIKPTTEKLPIQENKSSDMLITTPNKQFIIENDDDAMLNWDEDKTLPLRKSADFDPDKVQPIKTLNMSQNNIEEYYIDEQGQETPENKTQFEQKVKTEVEKSEILYQDDFSRDSKHIHQKSLEKNIPSEKFEENQYSQEQIIESIPEIKQEKSLFVNGKRKSDDYLQKIEEPPKSTKLAKGSGPPSGELYQDDFEIADDYKINKDSLSIESLPKPKLKDNKEDHKSKDFAEKTKNSPSDHFVDNPIHQNDNIKYDQENQESFDLPHPNEVTELKEVGTIKDAGNSDLKQLLQSKERLELEEVEKELEEVEKLLKQYDNSDTPLTITKKDDKKSDSEKNLKLSVEKKWNEDTSVHLDTKSQANDIQPENSKRTVQVQGSPKSARKNSSRYAGFQELDNEDTKVETFTSKRENSTKLMNENQIKLSPFDKKFTLSKKDPLPPLMKFSKADHKESIKMIETDKEKNKDTLQHTIDHGKDANSSKQQKPSDIKQHETENSIQPVYASAKNTNQQEDQEFDIEDFELP